MDPAQYLAPGAIGRALIAARGDGGRYLSFDERIAKGSSRGFLSHQLPNIWPAYENGRSTLFGIDEIQGYSPIQLVRYWKLVRDTNTVPIFYNAASLQSVNPALMRLFSKTTLFKPAPRPGQMTGVVVMPPEYWDDPPEVHNGKLYRSSGGTVSIIGAPYAPFGGSASDRQ